MSRAIQCSLCGEVVPIPDHVGDMAGRRGKTAAHITFEKHCRRTHPGRLARQVRRILQSLSLWHAT